MNEQLTALIKKYFPKEQWANAMKVAQGESSYGVNLENVNSDGTRDLGPFQINSIHAQEIKRVFGYNYDDLKNDFEKNVQVAKWLYDKSKGWHPWVYAKNNGISGYTPSPTNTTPLPTQPQTTGVSLPAPTVTSGYPGREQELIWQEEADKRLMEERNKITPRMKFEADFKKYNETPKKKMNIMDFINFLLSTTAPQAYAQGTTPQPSNQYVVKPNDTLWGIAQQNLGSGSRWKELQGYTGDPRQLPIGTQITIPQKPVTPKPVTIPQSITGSKPTFTENPWLTNPIFQTPTAPTYTPRYTA